MKPFFERDGVQLYHGDCRKILPSLPKVHLVLTDPPYGIGRDGCRLSTSSHGGRKSFDFAGWDSEIPSAEVFRLMFEKSENQVIWGANYFVQHLPPTMGWLVWDKGQDICSSDCELAFTSFDRALRRLVLNRAALLQDGTSHPTQKPLALMKWCVKLCSEEYETILDPFCGSGTTLRAAMDLGRKCIGVEISEAYCEIAARRLEQRNLKFEEVLS